MIGILLRMSVAGDDCSQIADLGYWEVLHPRDIQPEGSASHCAVVWKDSLYIVGGESYNRAKMLYTYDFNGISIQPTFGSFLDHDLTVRL